MAPGTYNITVYQGDTLNMQFGLWQDNAMTIPLNLTGVTPYAQVRTAPGGTPKTMELTCAVQLPNLVNVTLPATQTQTAVAGVWDLELDGPNGVMTVIAGAVSVVPDVTRESLP